MKVITLGLLISAAIVAVACSDSDTAIPAPTPKDASVDSAPLDGGTDSAEQDVANDSSQTDFVIRKPSKHTIKGCPMILGEPNEAEFSDSDFLCTLRHGALDAVIYVQNTPTECGGSMTPIPTGFVSNVKQIKIGGKVHNLASAKYDWGGNHHNDMMTIKYDNLELQYYHSSFGFGWRKCQEMDCVQVVAGSKVLEDGCTKDRTLPIVCVPIKEDGTHDELVDTFEMCLGDPNATDAG